MGQPSLAIFGLARQVVSLEAAGSMEPEALAAAVDRACEKLKAELENLVGPGGSAALVSRSWALARRALKPVDQPHNHKDETPAPADDVNVAALAHLLNLLVNLMGEELALRPVRTIWPELSSSEAMPSSREMSE